MKQMTTHSLFLGLAVWAFQLPLAASPIATNLALWLEGNAGYNGTTWTDQSGNGHNATVIGSGPGTTLINGLQALLFTGQGMSIAGQVLTDPQKKIIEDYRVKQGLANLTKK